MDVYGRSDIAPIVQPLCVRGWSIDTAMAHWSPKVIVPVGAVNSIISVEIHDVRDVGQVIIIAEAPMAFQGKGGVWYQANDEVRNPYYGATMLGCADKVQIIAGEAGTEKSAPQDSGEGQ